ncbi:MAG: hypothetical protein ACR2P0_11040 [Acidimicrobiales bacterium]
MSHAVELRDLADRVTSYGDTPYLVYPGTSGASRINHVVTSVTSGADSATIAVVGFGRGVVDRVAAGAPLSLLWPAVDDETYSLIVDGTGEIVGDELVVHATGAVLHLPKRVDGSTAC